MLSHPLWRLVRQFGYVIIATAAVIALVVVCGAGFRTVPALGRVLDPGHGAWTAAAGGKLPTSERLRLPGLTGKVIVSFSSAGVPTIAAANEGDALTAEGYLHASFRLTQMDLERRLAEGTLAQLVGKSAVASDEFELRLGLLRTAREEWAEMPKNSIAALMLVAYSRGVNDYLAQVRSTKQWPSLFSMAGVYPRDWTPVDSLAVQGDLTQELDFTTTPLDYALLSRSLGLKRTMAWFPILPVNKQSPYDPGPYTGRGIAPIATGMTTTAAARTGSGTADAGEANQAHVASASVARAAAALLTSVSSLPAGQVHEFPDSNAWAANGPKVRGGGAMLAGDPHLPQTLPSIWYQAALTAPGFDVTGVSVPGLPGILLGHNQHIAWSLTDTENQATLFYVEKTSPAHPGEYFWRGQWREMRHYHYTIEVRGARPRHLTVNVTVHGPIMTQAGQTVSVDWMGSIPSPDIAVMQKISTAHDFSQFRSALASWRAPTQNFVYADDHGNIGAISAGYYPLVRHGTPWLPMPGTGADDIAGVIPYRSVPQSYDPPGHVLATANQRPVTGAYPYYIGTTANFFDPSYRASREYAYLDARSGMTISSFAGLQASLTDDLAERVLPAMLRLVNRARLTAVQAAAVSLLRRWNYAMEPDSPAAGIWWTWWSDYLSATFSPWWTRAKVPVHRDRPGLAVSPGQFSLDQELEHWTLTDPGNPAFSPPSGPAGTAASVLGAALATATAHLHARLGGGPSSWDWGKLHTQSYPSLLGVAGLGYGPKAAGGDSWTVDAAYGLPDSAAGPSWRMIVRLPAGGRGGLTAIGSYPGGQSENPASPWYENLLADWTAGKYLPLPAARAGPSGRVRWELTP